MGVGQYSFTFLVFAIGIGLGLGVNVYSTTQTSLDSLSYEQPSLLENSNEPSSMADLLLKFETLQSQEETTKDKDVPSPHDWIPMENIKVYDNEVVITLPHPEWAQYLDTNSMDPVIDSSANTIQLIPQKESEIHIGDIVAYESKYHDGIITHRVIEIGKDANGWFAILKGDNNPKSDPGKIRFSQIRRVVVAVIY